MRANTPNLKKIPALSGKKRASSRRAFLKTGLSAASMASIGPWIVRDAFSSSGELRLLMWAGYLPKEFIAGFENSTGIKVKLLQYDSNDELLNKMKVKHGGGFDLISPTASRALQWRPLELLKPIDTTKIPLARVRWAMMARSLEHWTWDDGVYHIPFLWGTEGMAWRTDLWTPPQADGSVSFGDMWRPDLEDKVMGRPHSMMVGIGLYLDRNGELKSNRMLDAYKDEDNARRVWSEIVDFALEHRSSVRMFWDDAETQQRGFMVNGVVVGQTWDGPAIALKNDGKPIEYRPPVEGALGWLDGLSMPKGAENIEQAYAFIDYVLTPERGGEIASQTGFNSVAVNAEKYLNPAARESFERIYPDNVIESLWWWPPEPPWYAAVRNEYRDRFLAS